MPALTAFDGEVKAMQAAWEKAPEKIKDDMGQTGGGAEATARADHDKQTRPDQAAPTPPKADMGLSVGAVLVVVIWLVVCVFALYKLPNRS